MSKAPAYGIIAKYRSPELLLAAAKKIRAHGYRDVDAFSPYPVEGLPGVLGLHDRRVPWLTLIGGIVGFSVAIVMQAFTNWDYPINVGGRAIYPLSAFAVVAFELTILGAVTFAIFSLLALNHLPTLHHPVFAARDFERVSNDRFFLFVSARDPKFSPQRIKTLLQNTKAMTVEIVDET